MFLAWNNKRSSPVSTAGCTAEEVKSQGGSAVLLTPLVIPLKISVFMLVGAGENHKGLVCIDSRDGNSTRPVA